MASATKKILEVLKGGLAESVSVVLLNGEDDYLHELVIKKLEQSLVDPDFRDFNFRQIDCSKTSSAGSLAGTLSELPTLVDTRLVVFKRLSQLSKAVSTRLAEIWEEHLAPGSVLLVTAGGSLKDSPFWTTLAKKGQLVDCRLSEKELDVLLNSFCRKLKRRVDPACLALLKERVGLDIRSLLSHLERCLLSLKDGEELSPQRIEALVPFSAQVAMWKMTKAIGQRNHREALDILDNQLSRGEQAGSILGYINSYLNSLVQVGGLIKVHKTATEVAKVIPRKTEYQVKMSLEDLRTWSAQDLSEGFDALARADFKSKGGGSGGDPKLLLQMLILKLCSRKRGRA